MESVHPETIRQFLPLEQVLETCNRYLLPLHPYIEAGVYRTAVEINGYEVTNGRVENPIHGEPFEVINDDELENFRKNYQTEVLTPLAQELGLKDDSKSFLRCFRHAVAEAGRQKRNMQIESEAKAARGRPNAIVRPEPLSRGAFDNYKVGDFLSAVKTLSGVTGESYITYGDAYETMVIEINASSDIEVIVRSGLSQNERVSRDIQANPYFDKKYKESCSLERLHRAYGIAENPAQ